MPHLGGGLGANGGGEVVQTGLGDVVAGGQVDGADQAVGEENTLAVRSAQGQDAAGSTEDSKLSRMIDAFGSAVYEDSCVSPWAANKPTAALVSSQCWRLDSSSVGDSLDVLLRRAGEGETVHVCDLTNHSYQPLMA